MSGAAGGWGAPVVDVDGAGQPTGLVAEIDPMLPIPEPDEAAVERYVTDTFRDLFGTYGVTTFGGMVESTANAALLDRLIGSGRLPARAAMYLMSPAALPLAEVRDTTGAGDAFAGGLVGYLAGKSWRERGCFAEGMAVATAVASLVVEEYGVAGLAVDRHDELVSRCRLLREAMQFDPPLVG